MRLKTDITNMWVGTSGQTGNLITQQQERVPAVLVRREQIA